MSNYYLLEKKVTTCSKNLRDKYIAEGYVLVAKSDGWNNSMHLVTK